MAVFVQCKVCLAAANVPDGEDPHTYFQCGCCPADDDGHHHGVAANNCPRDHEGDCWAGPQTGPKPDGCTVCRPLIFFGNASVEPVVN